MREKLNTSIFFGLLGNLLFIGFALVCIIYHITYDPESVISDFIAAIAYLVEFCGFAVLLFSDYLIWNSVRDRKFLKIGFLVYIFFEAVMMVMEINSYNIKFYEPYSMGLAIFHTLISAAICFSFLQFDKDNKKYEYLIIGCIALILVGMFGKIIGIRIYFSILINAISFSLLFGGIRYLTNRGEIDIDCHGDNAKPAEYRSDFFKD